MRKVATLVLILLFLTGCSKSVPPPAAPEAAAVAPGPTTPTPAPMIPTQSAPVDLSQFKTAIWFHSFGLKAGSYWKLPVVDNACTPTGIDSPLQAKVLEFTWESYPGLGDSFWVPVATLQLCNLSERPMPYDLLVEVIGPHAFQSQEVVPLPGLLAGNGTPPFKVYLGSGVPAGLWSAMKAGKLPWPELSLRVAYPAIKGATAVQIGQGELAVPSGEKGRSTPNWSLPAEPSVELLQAVAWAGKRSVRSDRSLSGSLDLFLYGPDLSFRLATEGDCDTLRGLSVASQDWTLWATLTSGQPRREGNLGPVVFKNGMTWLVEDRPQAGSSFLLLQQPGGCSSPPATTIWSYDPTTSRLQQPRIEIGKRTVPAVATQPTINADGSLKAYDLERLGPLDTWRWLTYGWDAKRQTWSAPPEGPAGGATTPGKVY